MNTNGLTDEEVVKSREKYGTNSLTKKESDTFFKLLIETLGDPIIKILLIALGIKVIFLIKDFDWYETIGIVIAIFIASFISSISEYGSSKAFKRLQEESSLIKCLVIRNKKVVEIPIDKRSDLFLLLTKMQTEVHNFTISYHKQIRSKGAVSSILDNIEGIGEVRKNKLLKKYKTITKMKEASLEELEEILPKDTAITFKEFLDNYDK